ncbi:MAG: hypothetical protein JSS77_16045 [Acidobacteria bacterium]|nr:hypothetical protein [Acidobacteriota bacterium]
MTLSVQNNTLIQTAPGRVFLSLALASFVGSTFTAKVDELFGLFYTDPTSRKLLIGSPWAAIDSTGIKSKLKQEAVNFDPNDGPPFPVGYQHLSADAEIMVADLSAIKLQEMLSGTAGALQTKVAATGIAGRNTYAAGGEAYPTLYSVLYQYPSKKFPGENEHVLIPFATFQVDTDYELSKKALRQGKMKLVAQSRPDFVNPDTGRPMVWIEDRVTAAAL